MKFKVRPIASSGTPLDSPEITIEVFENPSPPTILNTNFDATGQTDSTQVILVDALDAKFKFKGFFCSTGCVIDSNNYQVSETSETITFHTKLAQYASFVGA